MAVSSYRITEPLRHHILLMLEAFQPKCCHWFSVLLRQQAELITKWIVFEPQGPGQALVVEAAPVADRPPTGKRA